MSRRSTVRLVSQLTVLLLITAAQPVFAQDAGQGFWDTLIDQLYGWPGLIIGLIFFLAGLYLWIKEGAFLAICAWLVGVMVFFTPAMAQYVQGAGADAVKNVAPSGRK